MPFNMGKFESSQFKPRTAVVNVPGLKAFFEKGEKTHWTVRNLTANEVGQCAEMVALNKSESLQSVLSEISGGNSESIVIAALKGIKSAFGGGNVTDDVIRRMNMMHIASVEPEINYQAVVRIAEYFPEDFYKITNKILALTQKGAALGELKASGATQESEAL